MKNVKLSNTLMIIFSSIFAAATIICGSIDYIINANLTWSLIVLGSLLTLWCILWGVLKVENKKIGFIALVLSIFTIPLLFIIDYSTGNRGWWLSKGTSIAIESIIYLWIIYLIVFASKLNIWYSLALVLFIEPFYKFILQYLIEGKYPKLLSIEMMVDIIVAIVLVIAFTIVGKVTNG